MGAEEGLPSARAKDEMLSAKEAEQERLKVEERRWFLAVTGGQQVEEHPLPVEGEERHFLWEEAVGLQQYA